MLQDLDARILATLAYAGLFGAGLTEQELLQRLFGAQPMHAADIREALDRLTAPGGPVLPDEGRYLVTAPTKVAVFPATAEGDAPDAATQLDRVRRWAARAGGLPFVRFLGLTGSLAKGAPGDDADILVVAAEGRAFLAFALLRTVGRFLGRLGGVRLCFNFVVDELHLPLEPRDAFTATEFVTMVPLFDRQAGSALWLANRPWIARLCGSARPPSQPRPAGSGAQALQALGEVLMAGPIGTLLDRMCFGIKRRRLERQGEAEGHAAPEVICEAGLLKHHVSGHRGAILARFIARLAELRLDHAWVEGRAG